ncbi:MAG: formylglycine-generating enzyme family protein [Planctomycetota bacterium]|jgi:formylglycine-generating enzyme required for sulfatase activity
MSTRTLIYLAVLAMAGLGVATGLVALGVVELPLESLGIAPTPIPPASPPEAAVETEGEPEKKPAQAVPEDAAEALARARKAEFEEDWRAALKAYREAASKAPGNATALDGAKRMEDKFPRRLPEGLKGPFLLPVGGTDMHDNPVVTRNDLLADPATGLAYEIWLESLRMEFVLVPAGRYLMGSPTTEAGRSAEEEPAHTVRFAKPFYIGKYEVTQTQWQLVMGSNPSSFQGAHRPVEYVRWAEAADFADRLGRKKLADAKGCHVRLPSEAEWEYAARAGTGTRFSFGDHPEDLPRFAWFKANAGQDHHRPVGRKASNPWGLYDVHGNVWEWCLDEWTDDHRGAPADGRAREGRPGIHVMRGGSWDYEPHQCRSASRSRGRPDFRDDNTGFRLVLVFGGD